MDSGLEILQEGGRKLLEIAICEDNIEYREALIKIINSLIADDKINGKVVIACDSPNDLSEFIKSNKANVFLLDIELNSVITGYDLAVIIKNCVQNPYIVFISQHSNYVFKSFKVRAYDFLPKPISKKEFENVMTSIYSEYIKNIKTENQGCICVKIGPKIYQLPKNEILLIEKRGNKCIFHSVDNTVYSYDTLETILERLESTHFIRCHKGYIVNKTYIKEVDISQREIFLFNGQKCQVGRKYKQTFVESIHS